MSLGTPLVAGYDVDTLRDREFTWAARGDAIYLNNASTGPLPRRCIDAMAEFTERRATPFCIGDGEQVAAIARTRELCARLIGAGSHEIAAMVNTGYGINLAASALPFIAGDVVLTHAREFPANVYPWLAAERSRGVRVVQIAGSGSLPDEEGLIEAIDREPRVRAVAISWVGFATGFRSDLSRIGAACRERGAYLVVDAIQGVGAAALDLRECYVDILACGGQKWLLGPWGTGFVYVRDELARTLVPTVVGWLSVQGSADFTNLVGRDFVLHDDARRFEMMTLPYQDFVGWNASLDLLAELTPGSVQQHVQSLAGRIVAWAESRRDVQLVTPADGARRAGIVALRPTRDPSAVSARLREAGVVHSFREGAIRLSPHCYNTVEEIDAALRILDRSV
ncbi:MAG: aminotransferase class V-fold PLP-dependent enzyme [Gemmatimonadaceae bacterium]